MHQSRFLRPQPNALALQARHRLRSLQAPTRAAHIISWWRTWSASRSCCGTIAPGAIFAADRSCRSDAGALSSAHVFLYLSKEKSFGNVFREAMVCGLPVAALDTPRCAGSLTTIVGTDDPADIANIINSANRGSPAQQQEREIAKCIKSFAKHRRRSADAIIHRSPKNLWIEYFSWYHMLLRAEWNSGTAARILTSFLPIDRAHCRWGQ